MFTPSGLCRAATLALIVSTTLLGSAAALAQQRQLDIRWSPRAGQPTAFVVELKPQAGGKLAGAIVPLGPRLRIEGQRSALRASANATGMQMSLDTLWQQVPSRGTPVPRGRLSVEVDTPQPQASGGTCTAPSCRGGGADIIVFDIVDSATRQASSGGGGDIIVFDIVDAATPVATRIRIDARPEQQLVGSPAHWQWFNRPGPGEPLIATIPALLPGQALNAVLEVRDALAPGEFPYQVSLLYQF